MNLPDLLGKVKIDNSQAKAALGEVKAESASAGAAMGTAGKSGLALAMSFGAVATAAAAAAGVVSNLIQGFAETGSKLVDLNKQLGIGVVEIQKIQYAAKQSGVEFSSVTTALTQMEKAASKSPEKFAQLGISFEQVKNAKPDQLLGLIADGMKGVGEESDRTRIAMEIFGRGGSQILKLLMDDYRGLTAEAESTGLMTEEMAAKADRLDDASSKLDDTIKKLKDNLGAAFASPGMITIMEKMAGLIGLMARNADKLAAAASIAGGAFGGQFAANLLFGPTEENFSGVKGGGSSGAAKVNDTISGDASRVRAANLRDEVKEVNKLHDAEKRLFDQRSDALAKTANFQKGVFWNMNRDLFQTTGLDVPQGPNGGPKKFDLWGDPSKFLPPEIEGGIHIVVGEQEKAVDSSKRWALALQGVALMAGAIGGKIGATAQVMANIAESFKGFSEMTKSQKFNAIAGGVGQIGGLIGGTGGSAIQGAAGGAMTGFSLGGPVGAVVGGLAGGIMGLFGGKAKAKAELADLKTQLSALSDEAKHFGINLDAAFASKNSSVVKAAIESVNSAMKESEKRIAGLNTAAGGLNTFVKGGAVTDQASADRAGMYAGAIFGGQVKETGDVVGALKSIGPALEEIQRKSQELGLSLGAGVSNLIQMNGVLSQNEGLADQLSGLNQMMKGLTDAGMMNKDMFSALGTDATAVFNKLVEGGATGTQAMTMMQPTLQQLYEGQKLHGFAVDEATQALIDQAKAEGIVGDSFMSANERMVELLGILIETIGGKLPASYKRAGDAAEEYARRASGLPGAPGSGGGETGGYTGGEGGDGSGPGFASGTGFRNFGSGTRVTLHGEETVMTRPQVDRLVAMAVAGAPGSTVPQGGGGQPIVVNLMVDGKVMASVMTDTLREEGREANEFRSAYRGER